MTNSRKPIILSSSRILTCGKLSLLALLALLFVSSFAQAEMYTDDTIPTVDITTDAIFDITNTAAYSGVISGSGTVSKIGAGALTLSGANTYTGATSVSAGTLTFSSSDLPKSAMTATDGTLVLGTSGNAITAPGGTKIKTDSGAVRVDGNLNVNSGILTVKGDWTGAGAINVNGDTTATGQLRVDTSFSYATGITLNGGILRNSNDTDTNVTINAPINVASDSSLQSGWSKFVTLSGALTGCGNITIPTDSGYVRFEGDGSGYNGALTVQGKIRIGVNGTDTTNSKNFIGSKTITLDGGTIMNSNNSVTITNDIVMSKESYFQAGWGNNNKTIKLTGSISGSGKFHVLSDSGKVIVSTTCQDNLFTGDVHTDYESDSKFGSLQLGTDNPFGTNAGEARIWGTLDLNGHKQTFAGLANSATATTGKVKGNNSSVLTLKLNSNASKVYGGVFEGAMNLVLTGDGTGTQILKKAPAYTGSTTVQAGTLQLDAGGTLYNLSGAGTVKFGSKTLTLSNSADTTFSGSLSGSGKVTFQNNSSWIEMAQPGAFTGDVQLNYANSDSQGRVRLGADNALGTANRAYIYGSIDMNGYDQSFAGMSNNGDKGSIFNETNTLSTLTIDTTSLTESSQFHSSIKGKIALVLTGTGIMTLTKAPEYTGSTTVETGTLALTAGGTLYNLSGAGDVNYGANALTLSNSAATTFSGDILGSGAFKKTGTGALTLAHAPENADSTTVEQGTLILSNGGKLNNLFGGSLAPNGDIAVAATLESANDLTLTNSQLSKFIGSIFATGKQIEKKGDGTLQIYTGANGKVDAQSLVVSSGNLDFKGYMTGGITVNPDTVFSPGNSVGEATFGGGYILKEDATLLIEQDATGMDKLTADTFTIDENSVLDLSFSSVQPGATYPILVQGAYDENDEFVSRNFDGALATDDFWNGLLSEEDAYFWNLKVEGDTVYATMDANAVPEPSTWALLILGAAGLMYWRKRKNA